ncbi:hypothetical protein GCM10027034_41220 [Ramlibacter solisilvae]
MIELANDPKASPPGGWRATAAGENRKTPPDMKPGRAASTWPFPSRYAARPAQQDLRKPAANDSGS